MNQSARGTLGKYCKRPKVPQGASCEGCGIRPARSADHCHKHGWVRGFVCQGCNRLMGFIDRHITPNAEATLLATLLVLQQRCPDCEQVTISDLGPHVPNLGWLTYKSQRSAASAGPRPSGD